jgi:hypothetical protein
MSYQDLLKDVSESKDDGNYFLVTITDLDLATQYPIQFRWKNKNGTLGAWSVVKYFTTLGATVPNDPQLQSTDVVGGAGFIKVSWSGNDASGNPISNFDRVDVHISGTTFGDGAKPSGSFKSSGTQTFTAAAGIYIVQLKVYSLNGTSSFFSTARTVTVTEIVEEIQTPVAPTGFTSSRILGGIEVAWAGTYGSAWTGFEAINIYAGTSSSATVGTYIKVGQMTANKIENKIVVPVDGTYVRYGVPVYIHASSVNRNGIESAISANVTSQSSGARSAIGTDLADEIISNAKLVNDAVSAAKILTGAITTTKIADDAITSPKIIANAITADKITTGAIIADKIATNAITATKILAGTIDVTKLSAGTISVNNLESGTLSATSFIRAGTAGSSRIEISSAAVSASSILAGLYIYNGSTPVLQAPLGGGLTITGSLKATDISTQSTNFTVSDSGVLIAKGADIQGTIKATSGYIGGETSGIYIAAGAIQNDFGGSQFKLDSSGKARFGSATGNAIVINPTTSNGGYYLYHTSGGQDGSASSVFSVSTSGLLTATGATFTNGTITVGSTDFWNSNGSFRLGGSTGINYSGSGNVTVGTGVTISGTITASALDTTALDIASTGAITTTSGNFGVTSGGILSATNAVISGSIKAGSSTNYTQLSTNTYGQGSIDFIYGANSANIYYDGSGWLQTLVSSPGNFSYISHKSTSIEVNSPVIYMYGRGEVNNTWGWGSYSTNASEETQGTTILSNAIQIRRNAGIPLFVHRFAATGTVEAVRFIYNGSDSGGINITGSGVAFRTPSDYRLKENIEDYNNSINIIKSIRLRSFNLKSDPDKKQIVGFVAHEFSEVDPELVMGEKDALDSEGNPEYQSIMSGNLVPYLAGALKEVILKLENIESRLDAI